MNRPALPVLIAAMAFSLCAAGQQTSRRPQDPTAAPRAKALPPGPVEIDILSQGSRVHGRVFQAAGTGLKPTLLMLPGWPGNPVDVAGLGELLPHLGVNMVMFNPRGMHASEGSFGFGNTLDDIGQALAWLARDEVRQRFKVDPAKITLAGHSFGGGMVMVYAAKDKRVRRLVCISGADAGEVADAMLNNPAMATAYRKLLSTPGTFPVRIADFDAALGDLRNSGNRYALRQTVPEVADRSILLIGGWEDSNVTVDQTVLPYYRALKKAGAQDVTFVVYHADHSFRSVSQRLASDIRDWLNR